MRRLYDLRVLMVVTAAMLFSSFQIAEAADVHVVEEVMFEYAKYPNGDLYGWDSYVLDGKTENYCYPEKVWMNEARTLTPPIKELVEQVRAPKTCGSFSGRIEAVSPTGHPARKCSKHLMPHAQQ